MVGMTVPRANLTALKKDNVVRFETFPRHKNLSYTTGLMETFHLTHSVKFIFHM